MKYWTLFALRILARGGLSAAILVFLISQFQSQSFGFSTFRYHATVHVSNARVWGVISNGYPDVSGFPSVELPGLRLMASSYGYFSIGVTHWLLCLTFLVATIATSWRWNRKVDNHKRADT